MIVPGTPTDRKALTLELKRHVETLDVVARLTAYGTALEFAEQEMLGTRGHVFLLVLDIPESRLEVRTYTDARIATEEYAAIERAVGFEPGRDVVLVSVESLASLRRAYPNYFLDTTAFVDAVHEAVSD